jgi:hypothetical protein
MYGILLIYTNILLLLTFYYSQLYLISFFFPLLKL